MERKKRFDYPSLIGSKYSKWTILGFIRGKKRMLLECICECGNKSSPQASAVLWGSSKSCVSCGAKRHGYYYTATNRSWSAARNRCNNKNNKDYANYGGRGIKMDPRWDNFKNFLLDMGEKPNDKSLDRINNDGNYEASNCRWATASEQSKNQRKRNMRRRNVVPTISG